MVFRNNVLIVLIIFSILISLGGTWLTLGRLSPIIGYGAGASGTTTVSVGESIDITLYNSTVAFGSMDIGDYNDTTDNSPTYFNISNDGSVYINVTASATDLWGTQSNPSTYFNISCRNETWWSCDDAHSNDSSSSNPIGTVASIVIGGLPFNDTNDSVRVDIYVLVPVGEASGAKSSTVTFTASKDFS